MSSSINTDTKLSTLIIEDRSVEEDNVREKSPEQKYKVGDIIWAKIYSYPLWPGIICVQPETNIFIKGGSPGDKTFSCHVRFCNDNGRRCWVNTIEEFIGKDELLLKYPKFMAGFKHNKRLEKQWQKAITEATHWLTIERSDRLIQFFKLNCLQLDVPPTPCIPNISSTNIADEKNDIASTSNNKSMEKPKNPTLKRKRAVKTKQPNKRYKAKNVRKRIKDKSNESSSQSDFEVEPYIQCDDSSVQVPKEIQQEIELKKN